MRRVSQQIGWSQESKLLYNVLGQFEKLTNVIGSKPKVLRLTFTSINDANTLVGDSSNVADWNTFFDLPTYGTPFKSVSIEGNIVMLSGGNNIETKFRLFSGNEHLLEVNDDGALVILGDESFGDSGGNSRLERISCPNVIKTKYETSGNSGVFSNCYYLVYINLSKCKTLGDFTFFECENLPSSGLILPFDKITYLGDCVFEYCYTLTEISFPNVISAGSYCFESTYITSFNLPNLVTTGYNCFGNNSEVTTFDLPSLITAGNSCFNFCFSVTTFNLPNLETADNYCFINCFSVTGFSLPSLVTAGYGCFYLSNATTFDLPSLVTAGYQSFGYCSSVMTFDFPSLETADGYCFTYCTSVTTFDLPSIVTFGGDCVDDYSVFDGINGNNITLIVPLAITTCNSGQPDGDIQNLQANNTVTIVTV